MKVFYKNLIKAYSGHCDGLVYYYDPQLDRILCRRYVKPKETPQNLRLAATMQNLKKLKPSPEFKTDLKYYAAMIRKPGTRITWQNVYTKMMYAMQRQYDINLILLTKSAIYEQQLPCICLRDAIEAGLLEPIEGYHRLDSGI